MTQSFSHDDLIRQYSIPDPAIDDGILGGMEAIGWANLQGCYGLAGDAPALLRACLAEQKAHRELAFEELDAMTTHQGTVYQVSGYVVPFLIRMLASSRLPEKEFILGLLTALANGVLNIAYQQEWYQEYCQKNGLDVTELEKQAVEDMRRAREAVHRELDSFMPFLRDADPETRRAAVELLSTFPDDAGRILPRFYDYLQAETADDILASLVYYNIKDYVREVTLAGSKARARFTRLFEQIADHLDLSYMVRFPAACAAAALNPAGVGDQIIQVILGAVAQPVGIDPYSLFVQPDPEFIPPEKHQAICVDITIDKAVETLSALTRPRAADALARALEVAPTAEHQHDICFALLCCALLGRYHQLWYGHEARVEREIVYYTREAEARIYPILIEHLEFDSLEEYQKQAVQVVLAWEKDGPIQSNLLQAFGIDASIYN